MKPTLQKEIMLCSTVLQNVRSLQNGDTRSRVRPVDHILMVGWPELTWIPSGAQQLRTTSTNDRSGKLWAAFAGPIGFVFYALFLLLMGPLPEEYVFSARAQDIHGAWSEPAGATVLVGNFAPAAAARHAAHSPASNSDLPASISQADLQPIVEEAVLRLRPELDGVAFRVQIVDLPGLMLGRTVGNTIQIDPGAAGFGWYPNPTDADFEPGDRLGRSARRPCARALSTQRLFRDHRVTGR